MNIKSNYRKDNQKEADDGSEGWRQTTDIKYKQALKITSICGTT